MDQTLLDQISAETKVANVSFGSDEYFAARFAGGSRRHAAWVIFAVKHLIENIPLNVNDPGVARLKLAWWRNQTNELTHPLLKIAKTLPIDMQALIAAVESLAGALDSEYLRELTDSHQTRDRWFTDAYNQFYYLLIEDSLRSVADDLCGAVEGARSLLRIKHEVDLQIMRIPLDSLAINNINASAVLTGTKPELLDAVLQRELALATRKLRESINNFPRRPCPAVTYALLTQKNLEETIKDGGALFSRKIELTPLRKLWISWRSK